MIIILALYSLLLEVNMSPPGNDRQEKDIIQRYIWQLSHTGLAILQYVFTMSNRVNLINDLLIDRNMNLLIDYHHTDNPSNTHFPLFALYTSSIIIIFFFTIPYHCYYPNQSLDTLSSSNASLTTTSLVCILLNGVFSAATTVP